MKNKLIFLDLDGTLLTDQKETTEETVRILRKLQEEGHQLAFTSGRPLYGGLLFLERMGLDLGDCYYIGYQGAVIYAPGSRTFLEKHPMPRQALEELLLFLEREGYVWQCFDSERLYCLRMTEQTRRYREATHEPMETAASLDAVLEHEIYKVMALDYRDRASLLRLEKTCGEMHWPWERFFSSPWFYEFCAPSVNKGAALLSLCRILDWDRRETVAVGDEQNDLPMLRAAGIGIAMKNAREEIRTQADLVTDEDHNHDGAALALQRLLL